MRTSARGRAEPCAVLMRRPAASTREHAEPPGRGVELAARDPSRSSPRYVSPLRVAHRGETLRRTQTQAQSGTPPCRARFTEVLSRAPAPRRARHVPGSRLTVSGGLRKLSPRRPSPGGAPPAPGSGGERSARMSLIILVGAAGLVWVGTAGGQGAVQAEVLDEAKRLYLANGCYACHGLEGRGNVGPDLTRTTKSDEEIVARIANGRAGTAMTPFRDKISAEDIRKLVVYLRSLTRP